MKTIFTEVLDNNLILIMLSKIISNYFYVDQYPYFILCQNKFHMCVCYVSDSLLPRASEGGKEIVQGSYYTDSTCLYAATAKPNVIIKRN